MIDNYVIVFRAFVEICELGVLKDNFICDRIVCGVCDNGIGRKLLRELEL